MFSICFMPFLQQQWFNLIRTLWSRLAWELAISPSYCMSFIWLSGNLVSFIQTCTLAILFIPLQPFLTQHIIQFCSLFFFTISCNVRAGLFTIMAEAYHVLQLLANVQFLLPQIYEWSDFEHLCSYWGVNGVLLPLIPSAGLFWQNLKQAST